MKTIRKWRRRRPGVYAWRTDRHLDLTRREWAYVGESVNVAMRDRCHMGTCGHRPSVVRYSMNNGRPVSLMVGKGCSAKPWTDLRPRRYTIIPLPWWLGWKWVLRPLETLVILALAPRYNVAKNRWNPRRVSLSRQASQRAERNALTPAYRTKVAAARAVRRTVQALGVLFIIAGLTGAVITR